MNVCARTEAGTAFPGDEESSCALNPGEAFAEAYRVLAESDKGLPFMWPIVGPSFIPDSAALQAVRDDARVGALTDLQLLGDGLSLAPVTWTPDGGGAVRYQVCGRRSVEIRVTRHGGARAPMLRLSIP